MDVVDVDSSDGMLADESEGGTTTDGAGIAKELKLGVVLVAVSVEFVLLYV